MGSAIVAGIESGWVNPVINREYALEEVQQVRILIEYSNCKEGLANSSMLGRVQGLGLMGWVNTRPIQGIRMAVIRTQRRRA